MKISEIEEKYNMLAVSHGKLTWKMITKAISCFQEHNGLVVNGLADSDTQSALAGNGAPAKEWPVFDGPLKSQPTSRRDVYDMFGNPGDHKEDKKWTNENIVECHHKHGNRLPGVPLDRFVQIHKDVEPYLREALRRAQISCPDYQIKRVGGHYWRPIRKKQGNPLSMHSWGIAVDINPRDNRTKIFKPRGSGPKAWSDEYMKIWPRGVSEKFVQCFTSCGFAFGCDWDEDGLFQDHTFYDPMHFEFVARNGDSIKV